MKLFYTIIVCLVLTVFARAADSTAVSSDTKPETTSNDSRYCPLAPIPKKPKSNTVRYSSCSSDLSKTE